MMEVFSQLVQHPERLILLLFPVLAIVFSVFFSRLSEGRFIPIVPNMVVNTLIQAGTIIATSLVLGNHAISSAVNASVLVLIFLLILVAFVQLVVFQTLREKTERVIESLFAKGRITEKENCLALGDLRRLTKELIQVDVMPGILSEHKKEQRILLVELLKRAAIVDNIGANDFLLPEEERVKWARAYSWLGVFSFILFLITMLIFLLSLG